MSKTTREEKGIAPGETRITENRYRVSKDIVRYNFNDMPNGRIKDVFSRSAEGTCSHEEYLTRIEKAAIADLQGIGLPTSGGVCYDPGTFEVFDDPEEHARKLSPGEKRKFAYLDGYLKDLGFGEFDNEMLCARILTNVSLIRTSDDKFRVAKLAIQIGEDLERFRQFQIADQRTGKKRRPRRKAWAQALAKWFSRNHPEAKNHEIWEALPDEDQIGEFDIPDADGRLWYVWREDGQLWATPQDDEKAPHEKGPGFKRFCDDYLAPARKNTRA